MTGNQPGTEQERFESQVRAYLKVLKQDPRSRVFAPLAALLDQAGHPDQAEKVCRRGLAHNPEFADGHLVLARALYHQKRLAEALQAAERALELNPDSADALASSAECLAALEQPDKAVERCMRALDIDPGNELARGLIKVLGSRGADPPAKKTTGAFRAVAPTSPGRRAGPAELFGDGVAEASQDAIDRVDSSGQPFAALSAGSQPPPADEEGFEVPTAPARSRRPEPEVSSLPPRPPIEPSSSPPPGDALPGAVSPEGEGGRPAAGREGGNRLDMQAPHPGPPPRAQFHRDNQSAGGGEKGGRPAAGREGGNLSGAEPAAGSVSFSGLTAGSLPLLHLVQSVIDRVGEEAPGEDEAPLRVSRSGRLALLVGLVVFGLVLYWLLGMASRRSRAPAAGARAATEAAVPAAPPPLAAADKQEPKPAPELANGSADTTAVAAQPPAEPKTAKPAPAKKKRRRAKGKRRRRRGRRR